jgi:hypothetical protein|tara:strand:- start:2164 stop:2511 length:348 start_codon:yes stop_codon:yes gene_type:complete
MSKKIKTLSKTKSGELYLCDQCEVFHLEFNNIYFEFTEEQFLYFKNYLLCIEVEYWEHKYACGRVKKKIPIPTTQANLVLMFNRQEIFELIDLFEFTDGSKILKVSDIDYTLIVN